MYFFENFTIGLQSCSLHQALWACKFLRRSRDLRPRSDGGAIMENFYCATQHVRQEECCAWDQGDRLRAPGGG